MWLICDHHLSFVWSLEAANVREDDSNTLHIPLRAAIKMTGTNKTFDLWTEDLIEILATYLEPLDMVHLGATCKHLYKAINKPEVWEQYVSCFTLQEPYLYSHAFKSSIRHGVVS